MLCECFGLRMQSYWLCSVLCIPLLRTLIPYLRKPPVCVCKQAAIILLARGVSFESGRAFFWKRQGFLSQVNYCYSGTPELHVLVPVVAYCWHRGEILPYQVAQYAAARAVEDAHARHTHEHCIVYEIHHGIQCLVAAHSAHVKVLFEV